MIYRLKPLAPGTTVAAFLEQHGAEQFSRVGRGRQILHCERYFAALGEATEGTTSYLYAMDLDQWDRIVARLSRVRPSLLIANSELSLFLQPQPNQTILYCPQPKALFARLVHECIESVELGFRREFDPSCDVSPHALVEEGAQIGRSVRIEANCYIHGNVRIGDNVTIKSGAVIGGQGFEFFRDDQEQQRHLPHSGRVVIGESVYIGSHVVIDAAVFGQTTVGSGSKIDNLASIAHNVQIGDNCFVMANCSIAGSVRVGDRCRIGLGASIRDGVTIGAGTIIGMHSCVTADTPAEVTAYGVPAAVVPKTRSKQDGDFSAKNTDLSRTTRLIQRAVEHFKLNLSGLRVITEAATGPFAVTASIAAQAGARVEAIAAQSPYGSAEDAARATTQIARAIGVADRVTIRDKATADFGAAHVVTNLGFVRPLDASIVGKLRSGAVIPVMYDGREIRPDEIDLDTCHRHRIAVVATNEDHPLVQVLRYCGPLAARLLFEQNIEILGCRLAVAGDNLFTPHLVKSLERLGAHVIVLSSWSQLEEACLSQLDALLYADYWNELGPIGSIEPSRLLSVCPGATVVQFVGGLDLEPFATAAWRIVPTTPVAPQRMWRTLAYLGPRPVIELHAAGLKAAELEWRGIPYNSGSPFDGLRQPTVSLLPQLEAVAISC